MNKEENICNQHTFLTVYNTYAKDLRRFLFFKTQDVESAEDLLQESFIKLWDSCKKVDYNKVKSYLFTIANNMFLNEVKHLKIVHDYKSTNEQKATNESPEYVMIGKEFLEKLNHSIESLPSIQQEVFLLSRIEKKKYKEISIQLNISVKAVEKRMHNALVNLRKTIGNI
jgi:RNA polymerase sigma-70 factor (ECF subfamily)